MTGATGLIGRQVLEPLRARGFEVCAVGRERPVGLLEGVSWRTADVLSEEDRLALFRKNAFSHLVHLAWITTHGTYWESPENERWFEASVDLVRRFTANGGRRVVLGGTCAEYDWSDPRLVNGACREGETAERPSTLYGLTKLRLARWLFDQRQLSAATGRTFFVFGRGENPNRLIPSVTAKLLSGQRAAIGSGTGVRDFLDSRDAGAAFAALTAAEVTGPVNIGSGTGTSIADVVRLVADATARRDLVDVGALPDRLGDPPRLVADVGRLSREVGFATERRLASAVEDTVTWWRERAREETRVPA